MSNHTRILCPVPNCNRRLSKWRKHRLRHLRPRPGRGRCQGMFDHLTPHPDLACLLFDNSTYIADFGTLEQFLVDHLEDHISAPAADDHMMSLAGSMGSGGSRDGEDSRNDKQDANEDSHDEDSRNLDYNIDEDDNQLDGGDRNHPDGSDTFKAEDACPAQAVASRPLHWVTDDRSSEDVDEAAQAILLQQVWAKEASSSWLVWGAGLAGGDNADEEKEQWEDEAAAADQDESGDGDPTAECDGSQGGLIATTNSGGQIMMGHSPYLLSAAGPVQSERSALGVGNEAAFYVHWVCQGDEHAADQGHLGLAPHGFALARLPEHLCSLKRLGIRQTHKLVKVVSVKLPELLTLVPMICLLEIARFWEHHPKPPKIVRDAAEDTICQLPTVCAFPKRMNCVIGVTAARRQMGSDAKIVAKVGDPQLDQLGLHTLTCILEGDFALLAKGLQMWSHVQGMGVFFICVMYSILSVGLGQKKFAGFILSSNSRARMCYAAMVKEAHAEPILDLAH
ncbi:hypothetical protein BDK51DRAFT_36500 [Blyttiomyces helicus]|uniref:Uncharacterized protein n=1 Tax=Blyttiomyces helicus TaxID=388810 RepID=A0A4P9WSE8_9FUNG|nr:hypothetical protein BDK51DRAFT_36500 [Blyttiomyces helicus]|eukprot:RKO94230.1 hypothetical protein BDK51DRAFT_36500 [Blyttiomyces helicus]